MADQQYTDAQLSDGRTLRFIGNLAPDQVAAKVKAFRTNEAAQQITANPPQIGGKPGMAPTPAMQAQPSTAGAIANRLISGPEGTPKSPSKVPQSIQNSPNALGEAIGGITGLGAAGMGAAAVPALNAGTLPFLGRMARGALQQAPGLALAGGINYARSHLPFGKYIPMGAEYLAMLANMGKSPAAAAEKEAVAPSSAPPEPEPLPATPAPVTREQVGRAVNESLDVTPPTPGEPIYNRLPFTPKPEPVGETVPAGHTATPGSSALSSYHYDPASGEFTAIFKGGQTGHVYGGISPEQVQYLEQAESKGKAFQAIKNSGVPVAKIVNGKRIELPRQVPAGDLTNILTRSLRQVQGNQ